MKELRINNFFVSTPGHEILVDGGNRGLEGPAIVRGWAGTRSQTSASQESCCTEPGSSLGRGRALGGPLLTLKNQAVFNSSGQLRVRGSGMKARPELRDSGVSWGISSGVSPTSSCPNSIFFRRASSAVIRVSNVSAPFLIPFAPINHHIKGVRTASDR